MDWYKEFNQPAFLELIAGGRTETQALSVINIDREVKHWFKEIHLVQIQVKDRKFKESLEEAKKSRADTWFNGIADSVHKVLDKDAVPAEKLKFEQRKYLAAIDNPDKYSEKKSIDLNVGINIFQEMKELKQSEIKDLMKFDPFVEAESSVVEEDTHNMDLDKSGMFE